MIFTKAVCQPIKVNIIEGSILTYLGKNVVKSVPEIRGHIQTEYDIDSVSFYQILATLALNSKIEIPKSRGFQTIVREDGALLSIEIYRITPEGKAYLEKLYSEKSILQ